MPSACPREGAAGRAPAMHEPYPSPLEEIGLNVMDELRERYRCPVGLSDHSGIVFPALAALARGADIVEVHVTLDRRMFGPDSQPR